MSPRTIAVSFPISNTNTNYPGLPRLPVFGFHPFQTAASNIASAQPGRFGACCAHPKAAALCRGVTPVSPTLTRQAAENWLEDEYPLVFRGLSSEPLRESKKTLPAGFMFFHQKVQFELNPFRLGNDIQAEILPCCMLDASCSDFQPVEVKARSLGRVFPSQIPNHTLGFFVGYHVRSNTGFGVFVGLAGSCHQLKTMVIYGLAEDS